MKKCVMCVIFLLSFMLFGCGKETVDSGNIVSDTNADDITVGLDTQNDTTEVTKAVEATPTLIPTKVPEVKSDLILPITTNNTGKVLIQTVSASATYPFNSYIISSMNGENVVVDATTMPQVKIVDINPAAITQTHGDPDHTDTNFLGAYKVPKLLCEKGEINTKDFHIYSILSSHSNDKLMESNRNVILVFEVDGIRIAHMGDIGQTKLTEKQLKELGDIDIAFMQFENSYSDMDLTNEKGFNLIEQLNPKIIIPTHYTNNGLMKLKDKYGTITEFKNVLEISKEELPDTKLNVYRILNKHKYF